VIQRSLACVVAVMAAMVPISTVAQQTGTVSVSSSSSASASGQVLERDVEAALKAAGAQGWHLEL
jgi:hypothetical protein